MFITFEGGDGSGKTTQAARLMAWLAARGHDALALREPGGTDAGDVIRELLLHHKTGGQPMHPRTELLLFCASRAEIVEKRIRPHLQKGGVVVCDRFADSTLAYQGYGRGLDLPTLRAILNFATGGLAPDLTVYLDLDPQAGIARRKTGTVEFNRLDAETQEFHLRVRDGYLALAAQEPARWLLLNAADDRDAIEKAICQNVERKLGAKQPAR
jgi:dTMP kinase